MIDYCQKYGTLSCFIEEHNKNLSTVKELETMANVWYRICVKADNVLFSPYN